MTRSIVMFVFLATGLCSTPEPLTAIVDAVATQSAKVGGTVELVVAVKNTGPAIPHLALVFRTPDRWYERHEMTDLGGCTIAEDASGFDCGDLPANESKTFPSAASRAPSANSTSSLPCVRSSIRSDTSTTTPTERTRA